MILSPEAVARLLDGLRELPPEHLEMLAQDVESGGGPLHEALAYAVRSLYMADRPGPTITAHLLAAVRPDPGELDQLIGELSEREPWRGLRMDLQNPPTMLEIAADD